MLPMPWLGAPISQACATTFVMHPSQPRLFTFTATRLSVRGKSAQRLPRAHRRNEGANWLSVL